MSSIAAMISSLKNNKRIRVSNFERLKNYKKGNCGKLFFEKKAKRKQLKDIRDKIQKENKKKIIKHVSVILITTLILIYAIGFVKL